MAQAPAHAAASAANTAASAAAAHRVVPLDVTTPQRIQIIYNNLYCDRLQLILIDIKRHLAKGANEMEFI